MSEEPKMNFKPFKKHIFVCTGTKCAPESSPSLYKGLKARLRELQLEDGDGRIQRSQSQCLGVCEGGPIVAVYPDGTWYHNVNSELMEKIIQEQLIEDQPVKENVLYQKKP